jgi:Na+-translocating ferredoxin:NAD+ oxidoreductase subunit G
MSEMEKPVVPDTDAPEIKPPKEESVLRVSSRTATILMVFILAFTALMTVTYNATKDPIEASALAEKLKLINEILPPANYDNDLLADSVTLPPLPALGLSDETLLYRARKDGKPVALVFESVAPDGYSGRINLVLAVKASGELAALRVTAHKETPGLGDYIDPKKDKHKDHLWINQFNDRPFDPARRDEWKVKKDGGRFDYMTGATISPRAVVNAASRSMAWTTERREKLFALPAKARFEE